MWMDKVSLLICWAAGGSEQDFHQSDSALQELGDQVRRNEEQPPDGKVLPKLQGCVGRGGWKDVDTGFSLFWLWEEETAGGWGLNLPQSWKSQKWCPWVTWHITWKSRGQLGRLSITSMMDGCDMLLFPWTYESQTTLDFMSAPLPKI